MKAPVIAAVLAGFCTAAVAADDYITNSAEIVKAADWNAMKTLTIEMSEHDYYPREIALQAGQPYKLELKNVGEKKHYFTAPEFFRAVASRKVQANGDGEVKAPYFLAFETMAGGGQLDYYFVPMTKGSYPFFCTTDDHRQQGMEGTITVE